ncbi:chaperonin GroL [Batrachochytrium salamandrivorans]|nr:chaperonin GroL [Batrachochytrium salamandrivorans]
MLSAATLAVSRSASRISSPRVRSLLLPSVRFYSSHKEILFGQDGRQRMAKGIDILARAVAVTLGPKGRNVIIEQSYGSPKITKDGVTVAKSISLEDRFENLGATLVQDVATKTNEVAGDGTTTATVLTRAIFSEGLKNVAAGVNSMDLRKGIQAAVDLVVRFLKENARPITTSQEIAQVATISANGDKHIGQVIANAMEKVGKEGVITVQEGKTLVDELEITEGMRFDRGYISPYFITDTRTQKIEFEKPLILLSERKISSLQDLLPALEISAQKRRPLLVIAEDVDGEALAACILNKLRGQLQVACVKAPGFGDNRKAILQDIAILTGGTVFSDEVSIKLDKCTIDDLGSVNLATVTKDDTIFLNGAGSKDAVAQRCEQLRSLISTTVSDYEREKLQERLAKLSGGVAVIKVGGSSEVEVGEKKDRFDDALNATRAAVEEGIVPGGGTAFIKASRILQNLKPENFDQGLGIDIVRKAILAPTRIIVDNAGEEGSVVVGRLLESYTPPKEGLKDVNEASFSYGYNAATSQYVDMIKEGIIDPLKVQRTALTDASSVASLLTTTEAMIVDAPKKEGSTAAPGGGMGGMGGMGADLDQRWLDGTVEHESMGTRHDNRVLAARLADFLQFIQKKLDTSGSDLTGTPSARTSATAPTTPMATAASTLTSASVLKVAAAAVAAAAASSHSSARRRSKATGISGTQHAVSVSVAAGAALAANDHSADSDRSVTGLMAQMASASTLGAASRTPRGRVGAQRRKSKAVIKEEMPDSSTGGDVAEVEAEEAATPAECGGDDQGKKDATGDEGDVGENESAVNDEEEEEEEEEHEHEQEQEHEQEEEEEDVRESSSRPQRRSSQNITTTNIGRKGRKSKSTVSATPIRGSTLPVQHDQSDMDDYDHSVGDAKTTKGASSGAKKEKRRGRAKKPALISTESANEDADENTTSMAVSGGGSGTLPSPRRGRRR